MNDFLLPAYVKFKYKRNLLICICISALLIVSFQKILRFFVCDPIFSSESGFYDEEFLLKLDCLNPYLKIYYTTDGTIPDQTSILYENPIKIYDYSVNDNVYSMRTDTAFKEAKLWGYVWTPKQKIRKAMVIKAVTYNEYGQSSNVITKSFFVGDDYGDLPVISITMDPDCLFNYEDGIYIKGKIYDQWYSQINGKIEPGAWGYPSNMQQTGEKSERPAKIELFKNGILTLEQDIGLRIRGGATRYFEQKSFSLYARKKYGNERIFYELFNENENILSGTNITTYDSFILRNWGNNWRMYMFIDPLVQKLVQDRNISTQASRPSVVFLNGEYWGLYDMKEKYSPSYFKEHYGIEQENIIAIKYEPTPDKSGRGVMIGNSLDIKEFEKLESFVKDNDLSIKENYNQFCQMVDINSFIDMYAIRIYVEATDFPLNNVIYWKTKAVSDKPYQDGKWRLMLYDVDPELRYPNYYDGFELFEQKCLFFSKLLKNEEFKENFVISLSDIANNNFSFENVESCLTDMQEKCFPYIFEYYQRYGPMTVADSDADKLEYYNKLYSDILNFFKTQKKYILDSLKEKNFVKGDLHKLKIINNDIPCNFYINTSKIEMKNHEWEGEYFSDFPIILKVVPDVDRRFCGWFSHDDQLISKEFSLNINLTEDKELYAKFE